ncbi:oligoendopeptidase F [Spiroplasma platyhelix]|uniref:Oligopeptidase F n=1 Tax=Spiroplasma platyhelix PALS-1 TaxID=1276218 RepID=A0A846U0U7_9MOLU|nr:oligoendopeptidase F [Spiroplasma platyhelix]MBE4704271.1 Oligoendopeptidase F, plasmid [Spiroplasma platyhelix PALS-1]NKE38644.1 oligoendopeptidase F [Spiroplasma platyhelix PALS-1]UJB28855.1 oligoendopeptidase F [Spiroplasma platyhelix PALS-1]
MKRSELTSAQKKQYCWDFSHLFKNDEHWIKGLNDLDQVASKLVKLKGKLKELKNFKNYLELSKELSLNLMKLGQYLHYSDLDQTNLNFQKLNNLFAIKITNINQQLSWIEPEIKAIGSKTIDKWVSDNPELKNYQHTMKVFFQFEKYILSEHDENLLSKVSKSRGAVGDLYDTLVYADKEKVSIKYKKKEQELTQTLYLDILENTHPTKDQELRIQTNQKFYQDIVNKKHSLAQIYQGIIEVGIEETKIRDPKESLSSLEYSLLGDNVSLPVYENLIKVGQKHADLVREFYQIKKSFFKLKKFYPTDTSLQMAKLPNQKYDVETGINIIKLVLSVLENEYLEQLNLALLPGRIDYFEDTNKRTGAYSSGGNGVEPIILMNWDDTINAINTLGHELGHSVHTLLADKYQTYPNNNYPIILAEVASTVNEHLIFDYLYNKAKSDEEKIYLLQSHIETIIGTFFRQIQFAEFEWEAHKLVEKEEPLNADVLADLYRKIADKYGQDVLDLADDKQKSYSWPRVSHFFHSPFYVYKYATSITVSYKLYEDIKQGKKDNLLKFLKSGGSDYPLEILKKAGVNLEDINVYNPLVENLANLINELKILTKQK